MELKINDYIDSYVLDAEGNDLQVARHLKEIIPQTTHLDERILKEIIHELKKGMDAGKSFKVAFNEICRYYVLSGNVIQAKLPTRFTRIILDDTEFVEKIAEERGIPSSRDDIREIVESKKRNSIKQLFRDMELNIRKVVFATFDENDMEADPFVDFSLRDIVNMLALDTNVFAESKPLTAVSIRYKNENDVLKKFPVFPDAGWYDKFHPSDKDDKYGRTKSLDPSLKNMPEIVHENLKLADVIEDIRFLEE